MAPRLRQNTAAGHSTQPFIQLLFGSRPFLAVGLLLWIVAIFQIYKSLELAASGCDSSHGVTSISMPLKFKSTSNVGRINSQCQAEYDRISSNRTPGITTQDLLRSKAWIGNQYRLNKAINTLSDKKRPFVAVVAGGSISLGHGTLSELKYSERLEGWLNEMYPLSNNNKHQVINVAAHGADMCSMAKRLNILYSDLSSRMPQSSHDEPDLIILEFAVNDYQGQDHLITVDHKTSVFFDGFRELVLCAEVVVHSLLNKYPNAAIAFLEVQTAILTRKSGAFLHMGIAQQYQIPVISYSEAMFPDYYLLIRKLGQMDKHTYSFPDDNWIVDGGVGIDPTAAVNVSQYAAAVLPFPHGCSPCQDQNIIPQFRGGMSKYVLIR